MFYLCRVVVVITTAQLYLLKPELIFCVGSNPARGVSEIPDGKDLSKCSRLEIKLNAFRRSAISEKQFIIILMCSLSNVRPQSCLELLSEQICNFSPTQQQNNRKPSNPKNNN